MSVRARLTVVYVGLFGVMGVGFVAVCMLGQDHMSFWRAVLFVLGLYVGCAALMATIFAGMTWASKGRDV